MHICGVLGASNRACQVSVSSEEVRIFTKDCGGL